MKRVVNIITILLGSFGLAIGLVLVARAQSLTPPPQQQPKGAITQPKEEFTLPIPSKAQEEWPAFIGVGHTLRYPLGWEARLHQTQGGVHNSATYQFVWTDGLDTIAQIDALEIVDTTTSTVVMKAELAYWEQQGEYHDYLVETVTVQKHHAWWIHTTLPLKTMGLWGTLWVDWGERIYRFRLHCQPAMCAESERQLRQMLSTLQITAVDWQRAPAPPHESPNNNMPGKAEVAPSSPQVVPYDRNAAYAYAATWWNQQDNNDDCYLWYNGSTLDCTYTSGDYWVDGAHFVNRAVYTGGRSIPGLWNAAAINVSALRDWLVGDGWTVTPAAQAMVGDVAIMGQFDNPCWSGLVVVMGDNPTLATHSGEVWAPASTMWCYDNGKPTYDKTYLHANTEVVTSHVYLPVVIKNYPPPQPMKQRTGIHLGSREDAWPESTLQKISGNLPGGVWPRAVVVQSNQLYILDRRPPEQDPLCPIAQARVRLDGLFNYLTEAQRNGVTVIIRITPSPGNFEDWENSALPHVLRADTTPAGGNYCDGKFGKFRAIDDIAAEMHEIYKLNVNQHGWNPVQFFVEPANEPNKEWYVDWEHDDEAQKRLQTQSAWAEMDAYFSGLYNQAKSLNPNIQVLTPPMAQGNYAETKRFASCDPMTVTVTSQSGYDFMQTTFAAKNDGYSWHNYWRKDKENWVTWGEPCPASEHIFQYFPQWLQTVIATGNKPTFVTEADLFSPCQESDNPIKDKDLQAAETRQSLWWFVSEEKVADYVIAWLLTEHPYSIVEDCQKDGLVNYEEIKWHQAYENNTERIWFNPWWSTAK